MGFDHFEDRIGQAADNDSQRALLTEIARWRASKLTDVPALRDGAIAISRLYVLLGDQEAARREAHSLVSLCQTPPAASPAELNQASEWLASLGGQAVVRKAQGNRRERDRTERGGRAQRSSRMSLVDVAGLVATGNFSDALHELKDSRGDRAELLATWARVRHIRNSDAAGREALLTALDARLGDLFRPRGNARNERAPKDEARQAAMSEADKPLSDLMGAPIPRKRQALLDAFQAFSIENPEKVDELAGLALRHHLAISGPKKPAPWLITLVARAMASGAAPDTRAAIADLSKRDVFAVTAYAERPFVDMVAVLSVAVSRDWDVINVRRGVLGRGGEPADRRVWTARVNDGFNVRHLAIGQASGTPYNDNTPGELAARLVELAPGSVLVAEGAPNAAFRDAATAAGITVLDAIDADAVLEALKASAVAPSAEERRKERPPRAEKADAPARPPKRDVRGELVAALGADELPTLEVVSEIVGALRRAHFAFGDAEPALEKFSGEAREARVALLLQATDAAAEAGERLARGTSLAIATAASNPGGAVATLLASDPIASRYGGPGLGDVLTIAASVAGAGWAINRAFRGPTGRERKNDAVLSALATSPDGIWRLLASKDGEQAEIWFLGEDTPEARAAIPRLMTRDAKRVVVLPVDADLLSWYATTGGPTAIGWTGDEASEVAAALA